MASYIDRSLGDGETIIARAHFHWLYGLAAWMALLLPGVAFLFFLSRAAQTRAPLAMQDSQSWAALLTGLVLLIGLWIFLTMIIRRATTEIGVTSHRFVEKYGLVAIRSNEIALPNIEGVRMNQSVLGRIFGYGVVRIEGTGVDAVTTPTIADPVGFVRAIQTAKEHQPSRT